MQICANCGEENPARFRLCGFCGTQLAPDLAPRETRKTVTIVFSDWAVGALVGPAAGGALADATGDAVPYLVMAAICLATLVAAPRRAAPAAA